MQRLIAVGGLVLAICAGCMDSSPWPLEKQLDESRAVWAKAKPSCGTYSYADVYRSVFGSYRKTSVEVVGDVATRAREERGNTNDAGATTVRDLPPTELAARSNTVEELETRCATIVAHDPATYSVALVISDLGVPTTCLLGPKQCLDDCNDGILLEGFACAPLTLDGAE